MNSIPKQEDQFHILTMFLRTPICEHILMEHARKEIASENICFWRAVTTYLDLHNQECLEERNRREQDMIRLYLQAGSEFEINISSELRKEIVRNPSVIANWKHARNEIGAIILDGQILRLSTDVSSRVRRSWKRSVELSDNSLMRIFYNELFQLDPSVRSMFKSHIEKQERMFAKVMGTTVSLLDNFGNLFSLLTSLGKKHQNVGVQPEHFDLVGRALINSLSSVLGKEFDRETRKSWGFVFALMATIMILSMDPASIDRIRLNSVENDYLVVDIPHSISESRLDNPSNRKSMISWLPCCGNSYPGR